MNNVPILCCDVNTPEHVTYTTNTTFYDSWAEHIKEPMFIVSPKGEVYINPDITFNNLSQLDTSYLVLLRALVNRAIEEKISR